MAQRTVLAVDIGASNGRAVLARYDGREIELEILRRFPNGAVTFGGGVYWDHLMLYREILNSLIECKKRGIRIDSIAVDAWAQDYSLLGENGVPGAVRSYRDGRPEGLKGEVAQKLSEDELFAVSGISGVYYSTLYQLYYDSVSAPALTSSARALLHVSALMTYMLCGEIACDFTVPAIGGLMDIKRRQMSGYIAKKLGIRELTPPLLEPGVMVGRTDGALERETGFKGLSVALAGGHDTASAAAAIPGRGDFMFLSSGTCSMLGVTAPEPIINNDAYSCGMINMLGADGKNILIEGASGLYIAQRCVTEWAMEGRKRTYEELALYAGEKGCPIAVDVDRISERRPASVQAQEQFIAEAGREGTDFELYSAVLAGLARKYAVEIEKLEKACGQRHEEIYVVGGGSRITALNGLIERLTGKRVISGLYEAAALGNAVAQLIALGELKSFDEARGLAGKFFSGGDDK